jgi:tRNA pseudouridine38/39 synthase
MAERGARKKAKPKKEFDWSQYHERQIAFRVSYLGWDLNGFVHQESSRDTVEDYIFEALERARLVRDRNDCHYSLCGRTDSGVSAIGNVISLRVRSVCPEGLGAIVNPSAPIRPDELNYVQILNGLLREQVRITEQAYVPHDFHARHLCTARGYRYFFHLFKKDIARMRFAAGALIGEHDFRGFCKFSPDNTAHCVRRIDRVEFGEVGEGVWYFEIVGSGFIWHQIRCIATVLFLVGDGFEEPEVVTQLLDIARFPGRPQYAIADPEPLVFWRAEYENVEWQASDEVAVEKTRAHFGTMLARVQTRAAVLKCFAGGQPPAPKAAKSYTKIENLPMARPVEQVIEEYRAQRQTDDAAADE